MDKQQAYQIWEELFKDREVAYDFASHPMKKEDFQNENSHYGWDVDVKKPFLNRKDNFIPCSLNTIRFRQGKPSFKVGNNLFEVRKGKSYGSFAIYDVTDRNHPINMDPTDENQDPSYNRERFHSIAISKVKNPRFMVPTMKSISDKVFDEVLHEEKETSALDNRQKSMPLEEENVKEQSSPNEGNPVETKPSLVEDEEETLDVPTPEETKKEFDTETALQNLSSITNQQITEKEKNEGDESSLLSVIEDLKKQIDENLNEIDALNQQVSSLNNEKEILGQRNIELTEERNQAVSSKEELLKKKEEEDSQRQNDFDTLMKANDALKNQVLDCNAKNEELKSKNEELDSQKEALLGQLTTAKEANEELSIQINEIQNHSSDTNAEIEALRKEKEEQLSKIQQLEQEKEAIYVSFSNEKDSFDSQLSDLNSKLTVKENEKEEVLKKYNSELNEKESLASELEEVKKENESLKQQLSLKEEDISKTREISLSFVNEKESLTAALEQLKQNEKEQKDIVASLKEQLCKSQDAISEKENKIQVLMDENENLKKEKESVSSSLSELNAENSKNLQLLSSKEDEILKGKEDFFALEKEKEELSASLESLRQEKEELKANYDSLEEQSSLTSDQLQVLDSENKRLNQEAEEKNIQLEDLNHQIENLNLEKENLEKNQIDDSLKEKLSLVDSLNEKLSKLDEDYASLQKEKEEKEQEIVQVKNVYDEQLKQKDDSLEEIQKENDKNIRKIAYLSLGGKYEYFTSLEQYLVNNSLPFNEEEIQKALKMHREWKVKDEEKLESINGESKLLSTFDASLLDEEIKKREKALFYFEQIFGKDKFKVSDFAGRFLSLSEYGSKDKEDGWDYALLDDSKAESVDNVFIANYRSLKDYRFDVPFDSNGHRFQVVKEGEKNKIVSADYIADPYDFTQALRVTKNNQEKTSPLIYLFVKVVGLNTSEPDRTALMEFFDLMDRTVKRCCPISFIEMKTVIGSGKGNYAFITFDGSVEESYHETLDYAVLLNSYRREYRSEGKLNAVIVLNEVEVEFSKRHLDYDTLLSETRDDELRALRYEFNMTVINSIIKRTLHIGPRILDKLDIDSSLLKDSQIGQGNFAKMYRFTKNFKVYNFVYSLTHKEEKNLE